MRFAQIQEPSEATAPPVARPNTDGAQLLHGFQAKETGAGVRPAKVRNAFSSLQNAARLLFIGRGLLDKEQLRQFFIEIRLRRVIQR